jgi:hypothetical protein
MQESSYAKAKTFEKTICRDAVGYQCSLIGIGDGLRQSAGASRGDYTASARSEIGLTRQREDAGRMLL